MQGNFNKLWKNRKKILEGIGNLLTRKQSTEVIAKSRLTICQSNICGYYDLKGQSAKAVLKGIESCGICGCSLKIKTRCLSCTCALEELQITPLWSARMTPEEEVKLTN